jgi:hypothetical protein
MKNLMATMLVVFCLAIVAHAEESIDVHGSKILYARPDATRWNIVKSEMDPKTNIYLLMFERNPIEDSEGRRVRPVIALICEQVKDGSDVVTYSVRKRRQVPFDVKQMLIPQKGHFSYPNSIGYEGEYHKQVLHRVIVGHMRHKDVGVQIICDTSDSVYDKVQADMRKFLHSVTFKK